MDALSLSVGAVCLRLAEGLGEWPPSRLQEGNLTKCERLQKEYDLSLHDEDQSYGARCRSLAVSFISSSLYSVLLDVSIITFRPYALSWISPRQEGIDGGERPAASRMTN